MIPPPRNAYRYLYRYLQPVPALSVMATQAVGPPLTAAKEVAERRGGVPIAMPTEKEMIQRLENEREEIARERKRTADIEFYHPLRKIQLQNNLIHGYTIHEGNISKARS